MSINIYTSNRLEVLAKQCGEIFRQFPLPPLQKEIVVVQSRGMARWLAMEFSRQLSVWANGDFPFPNSFVNDILQQLVPDNQQPMYERKRASWQIMTVLAQCVDDRLFRPLDSYLSDPLRRFQLSCRLADLFDQYIIYRPDFIEDWEQSAEPASWQAALWRMLGEHFQQGHRAALLQAFLSALSSGCPACLPPRITIFGVSSLSPFHIAVFNALSQHVEVNLFFVNPCRSWWAEILSEQEIARRLMLTGKEADELYLESGNPLLASMGHQARDFLALLQDHHSVDYDFFVKPQRTTLLNSIQADILDLTGPTKVNLDDSIVFHSCHGPMREVEVLQDHLLALFAKNPTLTAGDIIVMAPDIEPYSPLVSAVFGLQHDHPRYIPYSFADKGMSVGSELIDAFFALLDLSGGRYRVHEVLDLLKKPVCRDKFALSEADCLLIEQWLDDVAIRWGKDGAQKEEFDLPGFAENTWQAGLDRLLLGYAMDGENSLFADILPYPAMEGSEAEVLGCLLEGVTVLFQCLGSLQEDYSLEQWASLLQGLVDSCLLIDQSNEADGQHLRDALQGLADYGLQGDFSEKVSLQVVRCWLEMSLRQEKSPHGFLSGGVTFCSLLPMRAIPFQVICLLGMDDGVFPRPAFQLSFDLIGQSPRPGDRSSRHDDRYLFLEALLSARKQLYISYSGQAMRDDTTLPPSVLVSELLDYIEKMGGERHNLITCHRLQPFHPAYFSKESMLSSYSQENFHAARQLMQGPDDMVGFWQMSCDLPAPVVDEINLHDFVDFFVHPIRFFCRNRLRICLHPAGELSDENEPFWVEGLARYQLEGEIVESVLRQDAASIFSLAKARGILPHGRLGETSFQQVDSEIGEFCRHVAALQGTPRQEGMVAVRVNGCVLSGRLDGLTENGLFAARPAKLKGKDLLRAWIGHLLLHQVEDDVPRKTLLLAKDQCLSFGELENCMGELENLVSVYLLGLRQPLAFFPETSYAFAWSTYNDKEEKAWAAARTTWQGNWQWPGESDDEYLRFRYQGDDPMDQTFARIAMEIYRPIFANQTMV